MEDVTFKEILRYFLNKLWIVILILMVSLILGAVYSWRIKTPMYKSNTTLVLTMLSDEKNEAITTTDIQLNKSLISSYREIIKSKRIVNQVISELELDYTYEELSSMITVESVKDTELISISVKSPNQDETALIANKLAEVFGQEIVEIYNINNFKVVDAAETSKKPYNNNSELDIAIAGAGGLAVAVVLVLIIFYFDTTIKSVEEIEAKTGLPILGTIPIRKESDEGEK